MMNPEDICNLVHKRDTKAILDIIEGYEAEIEKWTVHAALYGTAMLRIGIKPPNDST